MATDISIPLEELLDKCGAETDFLRKAVRRLVHALMDTEVTRQIGAARHGRTAKRRAQRNGYRPVVGYTGGHDRPAHPQAAQRQLLPQLAVILN